MYFACDYDYNQVQRDLCKWYSNMCDLGVITVHVEDIIFHMFQYIQKLRTEGPQEWVFEECKVINVYSVRTFQTDGQDKLDLLIAY